MGKTKEYLIETEEKQEEENWALLEAEWEWLNRHPHSYFSTSSALSWLAQEAY